ncbi:glycoside hydrolase family 94 protein [Fimbriiglobus ruber]|uniref:Cellobiose phosphorylase n=1 Tax=Fimbriiglobus ruber TaxID=1908690 RepID=A0A225D5V3_9BACT|nr:glycoside hydrolase family 94 protein [Fimbriiglobus ruber]OWK36353.1 Cellobiose phosphorylase [Fimbriiglobus ruber]
MADLSTDSAVSGVHSIYQCPSPLRLEVAGQAVLLQVMRELADASRAATPPGTANLLRRFRDNARRLEFAYRTLSLRSARGEPVPADAEWLLDNYYVIGDVVREVEVDLPGGYYRELPALAGGPFGGLPRVYPLALALLVYTDSGPTEETVREAVRTYQEVAPLSTGELWAVPTMLRLGLLENLRRLADQIVDTVTHHETAKTAIAHAHGGRHHRLPEPPADAIAVAVWEQLRDHEPPPGPGADALHGWTARHLADPAQVQHREFIRQAANQVSIGNSITSLRLLGVIDWPAFFEATSLVEAQLRTDPAGIYQRQNFATRDRCRRAVESLARGSRKSEVDVARAALREAEGHSDDPVRGQAGWVLIGDGRREFERQVNYRAPWRTAYREWVLAHPNTTYFTLMTVMTLALAAVALLAGGGWLAIVAFGAVFLPASELAVALTNFVVCRLVPPRVLPKMDFKAGIPEECETVVVMPTLLIRPSQGGDLAARLELHYLSCSDPRLIFALLTDFADAPTETTPDDDACVQAALDAIQTLNEQYAAVGSPRFFLFHRRRQFNEAEGCWMGWERKRGKLDEFNRLLRGATDTSYAVVSHPADELPHVRFVLTLDADTVLPRDAARQMIATLAHPLNRPRLSADGRRVEAGYAILQPRVSFLYQTGFRSWFARLFAGSAGVDPYSAAVSDTYMDLFGRGTFTGKGLYDVDAFDATAGRAFPDNHILSHDLIESNHARCALATDIEVFDEFPARYHAFARREHRWVRGDWQLLPWLGPTVPVPGGGRAKNVLPLLERWKVVDNLRRSVVPLGAILLLVLGWAVLPGPAWAWTVAALAPFLFPAVMFSVEAALHTLGGGGVRALFARSRFYLGNTLGQAALQIVFLANQAWTAADAIVRTLYRLAVSRRHLLEWETAAATESRLGTGVLPFVWAMAPACVFAVIVAVVVAWVAPENLSAAGPVLLAWFISPLVAYVVSRPRDVSDKPLAAADRTALRRVARKTWDFFETFVGPDDNWLPPDNYQEAPLGVVAHRTSPTNIGLYMLAVVAAHDMGYVTLREIVDRLERTFDTLDKLEKHQGHFLNWYETNTRATLHPAYVSTVDSGNFLACLLALKHALVELAVTPPVPAVAFDGLTDTLALVKEKWAKVGPSAADGARKKVDVALADADAAVLAGTDLMRVFTPPPPPSQGGAPRSSPLAKGGHRGVLMRVKKLAEVLAVAVRAAVEPEDPTGRWADRFETLANRHHDAATAGEETASALRRIAERAERYAADMDFRFLYNTTRDLFSIGFNATTGRLDTAHYDLLASEAAIASFLAVARGQVPRRHWFQLARLTTRAAGEIALVSWGGTMFEYLMPRLLLPGPKGVLLDQAQRAAVARQIEYGHEIGLPWGISESGFALFDAGQVYQYQSFGVPGLGLKRGLEKDRVVAPYATLLAVDVDPTAALANMAHLRLDGGEGPYGFYEALDYTPARVPANARCQVVRSYMAHHQGMGFVAIVNRLTGGIMRRRLRAEPAVRAAELLLEERVPYDAPVVPMEGPAPETARVVAPEYPSRRRITTPDTVVPRAHLLSNGNYTVAITNAGGGFSRRGDLDVTRWRADLTTDQYGQFIYVRDRKTGATWSAGYQPTRRRPEAYEVTFGLDKADIRRVDDGIETLLEVTVVPDQDIEIRKVTLTNLGIRPRELDVTSYAEIVLQTHAADVAHPAFGKLFLETEWLPDHTALLCRWRPRSPSQSPVWAVHALATDARDGVVTWETDRARFLGRRRTPADPVALADRGAELSGTTGAVLDPAFAIRKQLTLAPGEKATVTFSTGVVATREAAVSLADQYHAPQAVARAFELAWAHARIELQHTHVRPEDVHLFQRLAGYLLFPVGPLRAPAATLAANTLGQSGLWKFGISGDLPILVLQVHGPNGMLHFRQLLEAHSYWRSKGLKVDLVALLENAGGYHDELQAEAVNLVRASGWPDRIDQPGGVFLRKGWQMEAPDRTLLLAAARVVVDDRKGALGTQAETATPPRALPTRRVAQVPVAIRAEAPARPDDLKFRNGLGGFSRDGREYVIAPDRPDAAPPAPWSNVMANPAAGFLVTDSGGGFTWAGNSQSNRLTPWSNDPLADPPGDAIYLQDDASGGLWCPTPLPVRDRNPFVVRHGQGYSVFERVVQGVEHELTVFVPPTDPVKVSILRLRNTGSKPRKFVVAYYAEWVLGTSREVTAQHIVTEADTGTSAIFARNPFNPDFPTHVGFAATSLHGVTVTGDRTEFLGRNSSLAAPASFDRIALSGRVGPGLDPCAAIRGTVTIAPGAEEVIVFALGQTPDVEAARRLIRTYTAPAMATASLKEVIARWDAICGAVRVRTPDPAFDMLMNRWLVYQTLACRVWGRSAFYQSGGAYGFRDQLQDVAALVHAAPGEARAHLLRAARRQFLEGDVQHWWHEPAGNGVRTRFSDDFLWLPYVVCHYIDVTGDTGVLAEVLPFLSAPVLGPDEHERYAVPAISEQTGTLFEHCVRALNHGWQLGQHGLPLMGIGDWNDGMSAVGVGGRGESVWVAWFQIVCLTGFAKLADRKPDTDLAHTLRSRAEQLREAVEAQAYDGEWYRRAYFDDGTPLGSKVNDECRIDSIVQTWAVISGVADPARAASGMAEVMKQLVKPAERLVLLFDPPFDTGPLQPGYIKGYVPGVRENGGQYTHAATWVVKALAELGRGADAVAVYDMLNPVRLTDSEVAVARYRGEPYVLAGDVYGRPPHVGRAGWTWYTGSAAWMYRVGLEDILGLHRTGDRLRIEPSIPPSWPEFQIDYRFGQTTYQIRVENGMGLGRGATRVLHNGVELPDGCVLLKDDGGVHDVVVAADGEHARGGERKPTATVGS